MSELESTKISQSFDLKLNPIQILVEMSLQTFRDHCFKH